MATISIAQPGGVGAQTANCVVAVGCLVYPTFNGTATTLAWTLPTIPSGSAAVIVSPSQGAPNFPVDLEGTYVVQCVVTGTDSGTYTFTCVAQKQAQPAAAKVLYGYEPVPFDETGSTVISMPTGTSGVASYFPFALPGYVRADYLQMALSMNFLTAGNSSGQQTHSISWGIFSRGLGASSSTISQVVGGLYTMGVTANNSTYSVNQAVSTSTSGYSTAQVSSGGEAFSASYTGAKMVFFPVNSTLSPGQYLLGLWGGMSTSSTSLGISNSYIGYNNGPSTIATMSPIGSNSSDYTVGTAMVVGFGGNWNFGHASHTVAGLNSLPSTLALSLLTGNVGAKAPIFKFVASQ